MNEVVKLSENILLYHLTHINNLQSILQQGNLWSHALVRKNAISYKDVANQDVQTRRERTKIPIGVVGSLHEYVPFYFAPRSPMLYALCMQQIPQNDIVYFMTNKEMIQQYCSSFVFTDAHAIRRLTNFYTQLSDLNKIDWELMKASQWADTDDDPNRKARRQAEFLVYNEVPLSACLGFAVYSNPAKRKVEEMLQDADITLPVAVRKSFYF